MKIKNRIKEIRVVKASELIDNPHNWREHPDEQREVVRGLLSSIGMAGAVLARESDAGLVLIDGHLRKEELGDNDVHVIITDLTEDEADQLLLVFDPVGDLAAPNYKKFSDLAGSIVAEDSSVAALIGMMTLNANDLAMETIGAVSGESEEKDPRSGLSGSAKVKIKIVLACDQVKTLEEAIHATGTMNRAEAVMKICEEYLGGKKR